LLKAELKATMKAERLALVLMQRHQGNKPKAKLSLGMELQTETS
jgi:hypothetical protein